jgi:hypothetical protein
VAELPNQIPSFDVGSAEPLIGIPVEANGQQMVRYFTDEASADRALVECRPRTARRLAGAWKRVDPDLDWEELANEFDRIRHESKPTPPIEFDP